MLRDTWSVVSNVEHTYALMKASIVSRCDFKKTNSSRVVADVAWEFTMKSSFSRNLDLGVARQLDLRILRAIPHHYEILRCFANFDARVAVSF